MLLRLPLLDPALETVAGKLTIPRDSQVRGTHLGCRKKAIARGLPGRANATIRSPAASVTSLRSGAGTAPKLLQSIDLPALFVLYVCSETAAPRPGRSRRGQGFRSLRLSVRTPPFHGGESGSIPLGSATCFLCACVPFSFRQLPKFQTPCWGSLCRFCSTLVIAFSARRRCWALCRRKRQPTLLCFERPLGQAPDRRDCSPVIDFPTSPLRPRQ